MSIDAIQTTNAQAGGLGVNELDFLKLFIAELSYQDPLKPMDNREFMTQMAQFSALQEARDTNETVNQLKNQQIQTQAISLIGKRVELHNNDKQIGEVTSINFVQGVPELNIKIGDQMAKAQLSDVTWVK